jgi:hypothetical protein
MRKITTSRKAVSIISMYFLLHLKLNSSLWNIMKSQWILRNKNEWARFEAFTTVTMKNAVSEERIASIFRVAKSGSKEPAWASGCRLAADPEDLGDKFLRNVGSHKIYMALHPTRRYYSKSNEIKSQKIHSLYITKTCRLMVFRKIIDVYSENHRKPINALYEEYSEFYSRR